MIEERFYNKIVSFKKDDIFKKCFFENINFFDMDISYVSFYQCYFINCYFYKAKINNASFISTTFQDCWIEKSNLNECYFSRGAILQTTIEETSLNDCKLSNVVLQPAVVDKVEILRTKFISCPGYSSTVPGGKITAYKKLQDEIIVKLTIPETARRVGRAGEKCRADKAIVESFYNCDGTEIPMTCGYSCWDESFKYEKGKVVVSSGFDENRWNECGEGIHFFLTFEEARNYEWI